MAATANGVPTQTAYGYIIQPGQDGDGPRARGGAVHRKVEEQHVEKLISYVEDNPLISLKRNG